MTVFIMVFSVFFVAGISHVGSRLCSDVIRICHHHPPGLVDEVGRDIGGRVGPGAGQGMEAGRGIGGHILIQKVTHIRETFTLRENIYWLNQKTPIVTKIRNKKLTHGSAVSV